MQQQAGTPGQQVWACMHGGCSMRAHRWPRSPTPASCLQAPGPQPLSPATDQQQPGRPGVASVAPPHASGEPPQAPLLTAVSLAPQRCDSSASRQAAAGAAADGAHGTSAGGHFSRASSLRVAQPDSPASACSSLGGQGGQGLRQPAWAAGSWGGASTASARAAAVAAAAAAAAAAGGGGASLGGAPLAGGVPTQLLVGSAASVTSNMSASSQQHGPAAGGLSHAPGMLGGIDEPCQHMRAFTHCNLALPALLSCAVREVQAWGV